MRPLEQGQALSRMAEEQEIGFKQVFANQDLIRYELEKQNRLLVGITILVGAIFVIVKIN